VKRVLVTGAGGFLGGAIQRRLAERGDIEAIAAIRRPSPRLPQARLLELGDRAAIAEALGALRPDVVVHAAGRTNGSAADFQADNVAATTNLAQAIGEASPGTGLILLSSAAQYGRSARRKPWRETDPCQPIDAYGASKLAAERAAFDEGARQGTRVAALRVFNVISGDGAGDTAFSSFIAKAMNALASGPPLQVEMSPLGAIRDFVAVEDFLRVLELAIERAVWGETINVCAGTGRTVRELIESAVAAIGFGLTVAAPETPAPLLDWSIGDPSLCRSRLGFAPSSDLTPLIGQAAERVKAAALERRDA
jgi:GDP-4-dehydro-6-deoxy-D-mannose reductase